MLRIKQYECRIISNGNAFIKSFKGNRPSGSKFAEGTGRGMERGKHKHITNTIS
jgi:hypothetical protein